MTDALCPDADLEAVVRAMESDGGEMGQLDRLLASFPDDARLHFLRGSSLAAIGRPIEAFASLRRAVDLAPDFAIARFQLGFFQLTSGEAAAALESWGPLALLPENHYLREFVAGLTFLIRDDFADALEHLRAGMAANEENAPLNRDMQLIADQVVQLIAAPPPQGEAEAASATSFLLDQIGAPGGRPN